MTEEEAQNILLGLPKRVQLERFLDKVKEVTLENHDRNVRIVMHQEKSEHGQRLTIEIGYPDFQQETF